MEALWGQWRYLLIDGLAYQVRGRLLGKWQRQLEKGKKKTVGR